VIADGQTPYRTAKDLGIDRHTVQKYAGVKHNSVERNFADVVGAPNAPDESIVNLLLISDQGIPRADRPAGATNFVRSTQAHSGLQCPELAQLRPQIGASGIVCHRAEHQG
jgi:hypothetical protein